MNIASKGMILVLTPLAFEIVFVGLLGYLLNVSQLRVVQENLARTVVSDLIRLREVVGDVNREQTGTAMESHVDQYVEEAADRLTPFLSADRHADRVFLSLRSCLKNESQATVEFELRLPSPGLANIRNPAETSGDEHY